MGLNKLRRKAAAVRGKAVYQFSRNILAPFVGLYYNLHTEGSENIPKNGPFLILSYHDSNSNILEIGKSTKRTLVYVARSGIFKKWYVKIVAETLMWLGNTIKFERDIRENLDRTYSGLENALLNGVGIVIFPGGTRDKTGVVTKAGTNLVKKVIEFGKQYGVDVPIIATGIKAGERRFGGQINVSFAIPVYATNFDGVDALVNGHVMLTIAELSGKNFDNSRKASYT